MPIDMKKFRSLPKVDPKAKKGGRKCDWGEVRKLLTGKGGFSVAEVWELTKKASLVTLEKSEEGVLQPPVSRFRTTRWLKKQADDGKMDIRQTESGAYVYMVTGIEIPVKS